MVFVNFLQLPEHLTTTFGSKRPIKYLSTVVYCSTGKIDDSSVKM